MSDADGTNRVESDVGERQLTGNPVTRVDNVSRITYDDRVGICVTFTLRGGAASRSEEDKFAVRIRRHSYYFQSMRISVVTELCECRT